MAIILDTSILIDIQRKEKITLRRLEEIYESHLELPKVTFISYFEFYEGLIEKDIRKRDMLIAFINKFVCLSASHSTARILANLRHKYEKKGIVIGLADLIIAAQVIENNGVLITKDGVFEKIEEMNKIILH